MTWAGDVVVPRHIAFPGEELVVPWLVHAPVGKVYGRAGASCSCLVTQGPEQGTVIGPDGIELILVVREYNLGIQRSTVKVWSLDSEVPFAEGVLSVDVRDAVVVENDEKGTWGTMLLKEIAPGMLQSSRVFKRGPHPTRWQTISLNRRLPSVYDTSIAKESDELTAEEHWNLSSTLTATNISGQWTETVSFVFKDESGQDIGYHPALKIVGRIRGAVEAIPSSILVGSMKRSDQKIVGFEISGGVGWPDFRPVYEIEMPDNHDAIGQPTMSVQIDFQDQERVDGTTNRRCSLRVNTTEQSGFGPFSGAVIFVFENGHRLRVPFFGAVAK